MLHRHAPRWSLWIAGIDQPSSVAIEDRKHLVEHVAHHLLEVIRALNRPVDSIHAFEEPKMGVAFLLSPLALGDVDHHPAQPRCAISLHHHGYEITHPYDASVGSDDPIFKVAVTFVGDGLFAKSYRPLAVVGVKVIRPECRLG